MTIPVIPGPFSFLESAGSAVGTYFGSREAEARKRLADVFELIKSGAEPTPELFAAAGKAAERLKLAAPGGGESLLKGAFARAALGQRKEAAQTRGEEFSADILGGKARASFSETEAAIARDRMMTKIYEGALARYSSGKPDDETARKVAEFAAMGTLPYYTAGLYAQYGRGSERTALLRTELGNIGTAYRSAKEQWDRGFLQYLQTAQLTKRMDTNDPKVIESLRQAFERIAGPEPTFQQVHDAYVKEELRTTPEAFAKAVRDAVPTLIGAPEVKPDSTKRPAGLTGTEGAAGLEGLDLTGRVSAIVYRLQHDHKDLETGKPFTAEKWVASFKKRGVTPDEMAEIFRALRTLKIRPDLQAALAAELFPEKTIGPP